MKQHRNLIVLALGACAVLTAVPSMAQWQWLDKGGSKVFSDRPPPADIPDKNILKHPGNLARTPAVAPAPADEAGSSPVAAASTKPATGAAGAGVDKELEAKKALAEKAEADKQKADEAKLAKARADNCQRARQAKSTLDSGVRMAQTNAKGERIVMDDAARAAETKRIEAVIASDCK